nr:aldo/keto reductase [Fusibacter paucivorans]
MPLSGLGTWDLNGEECIDTVATALQNGYQLIDTAQMYGNEQAVGAGIKKSGVKRDRLFLTTKLYRRNNSYNKAKSAIDESLKKLNVDYVDLLLLHEPHSQELEMYRALEEAYRAGKARAIGISNYDKDRYVQFIEKCDVLPAVNQLEAHVYYQKWAYQEFMNEQGTQMQAWSPLAQGIDRIAELPVLKDIGMKYQKSGAQVALRFLVQRGISVIPKSRHRERLLENLAIYDFNLSNEEMNQIKKIDRNDTLFPWTKAF